MRKPSSSESTDSSSMHSIKYLTKTLTQAQKSNWASSILLKDDEHKEYGISVPALQQLDCLNSVKSILHANPRKDISSTTMDELWIAVTTKILPSLRMSLEKESKIDEVR